MSGEEYCQTGERLRNKEMCEDSGCCHWNTEDAGVASFYGAGRCWSSIGLQYCLAPDVIRDDIVCTKCTDASKKRIQWVEYESKDKMGNSRTMDIKSDECFPNPSGDGGWIKATWADGFC